jgi:hypothetical protein
MSQLKNTFGNNQQHILNKSAVITSDNNSNIITLTNIETPMPSIIVHDKKFVKLHQQILQLQLFEELELQSITTDDSNNIYATGTAVTRDNGTIEYIGALIKLSPTGEVMLEEPIPASCPSILYNNGHLFMLTSLYTKTFDTNICTITKTDLNGDPIYATALPIQNKTILSKYNKCMPVLLDMIITKNAIYAVGSAHRTPFGLILKIDVSNGELLQTYLTTNQTGERFQSVNNFNMALAINNDSILHVGGFVGAKNRKLQSTFTGVFSSISPKKPRPSGRGIINNFNQWLILCHIDHIPLI